MYQIKKSDGSAVLTDSVTYIKAADNGCFILCPKADAQGICCGGTPYHLDGKEPLEGLETVVLNQVDAASGCLLQRQSYRTLTA